MPQWRIETPQSLDLEGVRRLEVRMVAGSVDVVGRTEDAASGAAQVEVTELEGPITVSLENGTLSIVHERLSWGGLLDWVGNRRATATVSVSVPADCPVELGVVSADAVVSGIACDRTAVKSVSGDVTLDGVRSDITAQTVSGDLESRQLAGTLRFKTVSGDLTVVRGESDHVKAETVSGRPDPRPGPASRRPDRRLQHLRRPHRADAGGRRRPGRREDDERRRWTVPSTGSAPTASRAR